MNNQPNGVHGGARTRPSTPSGLFVRALYDYTPPAEDQSSLSFRRGDVIQIITQTESGWWDGVINNRRGWIPSNYVEIVANQSMEH